MTPNQHDDTHAQFTENVFDPQLSHPANQINNTVNPFVDVSSGQDLGPSETQAPKQDLQAINRALRARVNELEIVNDLFRGRVTELEAKQPGSDLDVTETPTDSLVQTLRETIKSLELELAEFRKQAKKNDLPVET